LVVFTSEDGALEQAIIPLVSDADESIYFMTFSYTDYPLAAAMIERFESGIDVAGVFETVGSETDAAELNTLYCANIPVLQDGNSSFMHHKVIIVDESLVITGSMNFSTSAETRNDENIILIDNPDIAALYLQEFDRVWEMGKDPDPADMICDE